MTKDAPSALGSLELSDDMSVVLWAQTTRHTDRTHSGAYCGTGALSIVHTEGTDNQTNRVNTLGHTGAVNCTFRGHRQGADTIYSVIICLI